MPNERYHTNISPQASAFLEGYAQRSREAKVEIGRLFAKAEAFDAAGLADCRSACEIRCVGQHEVLPIPCGRLYAFAELKNKRSEGTIFFAAKVETFSDLRRAWIDVHAHFGYDISLSSTDLQRRWGYYL